MRSPARPSKTDSRRTASKRLLTRGPRTLAAQFLLLQLAVLFLVLIAIAVITVEASRQDFREQDGSRAVAVAENLADSGTVLNALPRGIEGQAVLDGEVTRVSALSGASVVQVIDSSGRISASSDRSALGSAAALGQPADSGRGWRGDLQLGDRQMVVGQAPIMDDSGRVIGAALVAEPYPTWWSLLRDATPDLLLFLGIAAALGSGGAFALSHMIRRRTRGLEPAEISRIADQHEALLAGIHEGVIGVDTDGVITLTNASARELLELSEDVRGRSADTVGLPEGLAEFLLTGGDSPSTVIVVNGRALVLNRRRTSYHDRATGTVTTVQDRSELLSLQSQMSAQATITDTLRAQTHEFDNRLHTISGLLQLAEYEEAVALIDDVSRQRAEIAASVTGRIRDSRVAALLIAKTSSAAEVGITLALEPESSLPRLEHDAAADVGTVIGNLVDNAIDACRQTGGREIAVRVAHRDGEVVVRVADSGPGVPADELPQLVQRGWSTKPSDHVGRGIGLALVQAIGERRGGSLEVTERIDGEPGAVFSVRMAVGVEAPTPPGSVARGRPSGRTMAS